jgi:hypothetical protein
VDHRYTSAALCCCGLRTAATCCNLQATLIGDMVTLIGAISIIGYLEVGQNLRSFMPLMVYAVPVTGKRWVTSKATSRIAASL